jgi:hypothetical protein
MGPEQERIGDEIVEGVGACQRVIAAGNNVNAEFVELFKKIMGYTPAPGDIFRIGNANINRLLLDDFRQPLGNHPFTGIPENVADK